MNTDIMIKDIIHIIEPGEKVKTFSPATLGDTQRVSPNEPQQALLDDTNYIHVDYCKCNMTRYIKIYNRMIQEQAFLRQHILCDSYTNVG